MLAHKTNTVIGHMKVLVQLQRWMSFTYIYYNNKSILYIMIYFVGWCIKKRFLRKQAERDWHIGSLLGWTPGIISLVSEINRIGHREELNYNEVTNKVSTDPIRNSGAGLTLQVCPALCKSDQDFIPTRMSISEWMQAALGDKVAWAKQLYSPEINAGKETQQGRWMFVSWREDLGGTTQHLQSIPCVIGTHLLHIKNLGNFFFQDSGLPLSLEKCLRETSVRHAIQLQLVWGHNWYSSFPPSIIHSRLLSPSPHISAGLGDLCGAETLHLWGVLIPGDHLLLNCFPWTKLCKDFPKDVSLHYLDGKYILIPCSHLISVALTLTKREVITRYI